MRMPLVRGDRALSRPMEPGEHLLVVSHTFPPYRGIGGRRWAKFAKALARGGFTVHVIHSAGSDDLKGSFWTEDVGHPNIVVHPLPQRYPTVLFKRPLRSIAEKLAYRFWMKAMPVLVKGNWFDKAVCWERQLPRSAHELIEAHGIRNVVVTGAPFRLMAHALKLKERHPGLRLVADFRDPWTWGGVYGHGALGPAREEYERELEAAVLRGFDRLISPAPAIVEHLRRATGDPARVVHIPHAIDPEETGGPKPRGDDGLFRMIYAGSLYGAGEAEAYFDTLLRAFQRARALHPEAFGRCVLDLYITGHDTTAYKAKVRAAGLQDRILFHAPRVPSRLFPRIARADLVLIFIPSINRDFLGTKFNEVFYLRRPVLHVGEPGLVSETIVKNGLGATLRVEELESELPRVIAGTRRIEAGGDHDLSGHLLERVTARLVNEVLA